MLNIAHAYQVVSTTDATLAPLGSVIFTETKLGNGEAEFQWPRFVERNGRVQREPYFTCRYVGTIAVPTTPQQHNKAA